MAGTQLREEHRRCGIAPGEMRPAWSAGFAGPAPRHADPSWLWGSEGRGTRGTAGSSAREPLAYAVHQRVLGRTGHEGAVDHRREVIVGDLPSAYVIVEPEDDGAAALDRYCELMEDWAFNVLKGHSLEDSFPVAAEATREHAEMLGSRIAFIRTEILESPED